MCACYGDSSIVAIYLQPTRRHNPTFVIIGVNAGIETPGSNGRRTSTEEPTTYGDPARRAHDARYWWLVGWWWEPLKWLGRVSLWLLFWPVGLWRSLRHGRKNREARERRGYEGRR